MDLVNLILPSAKELYLPVSKFEGGLELSMVPGPDVQSGGGCTAPYGRCKPLHDTEPYKPGKDWEQKWYLAGEWNRKALVPLPGTWS